MEGREGVVGGVGEGLWVLTAGRRCEGGWREVENHQFNEEPAIAASLQESSATVESRGSDDLCYQHHIHDLLTSIPTPNPKHTLKTMQI